MPTALAVVAALALIALGSSSPSALAAGATTFGAPSPVAVEHGGSPTIAPPQSPQTSRPSDRFVDPALTTSELDGDAGPASSGAPASGGRDDGVSGSGAGAGVGGAVGGVGAGAAAVGSVTKGANAGAGDADADADGAKAGGEWRALGTFNETAVSAKGTRVRAVRALPVSCAAVVPVLEDLPRFSKWIDISSWKVVNDARAAGGTIVMYGRHEMPFPFAARDYVVEYRTQRDASSDAFTLTATSVEKKGAPATNGAVRLRVRSVWRAISTGDGRCRVSYEYDGDLGGSFPAFMLEGIWKDEGPKLMAGLLSEARGKR